MALPEPVVAFTEHRQGQGWQPVRLVSPGEVALGIGGAAIQGGLSAFEGVNAHRTPDGEVTLFCGRAHAQRLRGSARRLCLADVDESLFLTAVGRAVDAHQLALPAHGRGALYLRPTLVAGDDTLEPGCSRRHLLVVLAKPAAGADPQPQRWWLEEDLVRGVWGALAAAKCGANRAAALFGRERARRFGYDDALWLDGRLRRDVTQGGSMNLFVVLGDNVVTPPADGDILPGVTRACCLALLRDWQVPVEERALSFSELEAAGRGGHLMEMFAVGTAEGVVRLDEVGYSRGVLRPQGGALASRLRNALRELEDGTAVDVHQWRDRLPSEAGAYA